MTLLEQVNLLRARISKADRDYYVKGEPSWSDKEYDIAMRTLKDLEAQHPEFYSPDSPSCRVGSDLTGDRKSVKHVSPMLSVNNVMSPEEFLKWLKSCRTNLKKSGFTVGFTPKIDGMAISLIYQDRKLVLAITRGDGEEGEDVTDNVKAMRSVPLVLPASAPKRYEIRGEVYWPLSVFKNFTAEYSNPRNGAVGALKQHSPAEVERRGIQFVAHSFPSDLTTNLKDPRLSSLFKEATEYGFPVVNMHCISESELSDMSIEKLDKIKSIIMKPDEYQTDGVVAVIDDCNFQESLGLSNTAPRWAAALKFTQTGVETIINNVQWQIGKTGIVTPVAILEPVEISGSTVGKATLHNPAQIKRLGCKIGDTVSVCKSGEIIPKILSVVKSTGKKKIIIPTECPSCGTKLITNDDEGQTIVCPNKECGPQIIRLIQHWAAKDSMDIAGLGPAIAEKWHEFGLVTDIVSLYRLKESDIAAVAVVSANEKKVLNGIEESKNQPLSRVLGGFAMPNVGHSLSRKIAEKYCNIKEIKKAKLDELTQLLGPVAAQSFYDWVKDHYLMLEELKSLGLIMEEKVMKKGMKFEGEQVIFTGALEQYTRTQAQELVRAEGGGTPSSISAKTTLVVAGPGAGEKIAKANKLGIKVIDEQQFVDMLKN